MQLVEREQLVAELRGLLDEARSGEGRLALFAGRRRARTLAARLWADFGGVSG
jgi:hypothetical protein